MPWRLPKVVQLGHTDLCTKTKHILALLSCWFSNEGSPMREIKMRFMNKNSRVLIRFNHSSIKVGGWRLLRFEAQRNRFSSSFNVCWSCASFDFEMGCSETWLIFGSCNIMEHINWLYLAIHSIINLCGLAGEKSLVCDGFNKYNKRDLLLVSFLMMMMMIEDFLLPDCWGSMYMLVSNHPWDRRL